LQNSGWMSGNPTLSPFSGWNELHGGSMERNSSQEMGQSGEADRRSRVLQEAQEFRLVLMAASLMHMTVVELFLARFTYANDLNFKI